MRTSSESLPFWPQIHAEVHAAVNRYSDGQKIAFGASVVLASGRNKAP